MPNAIINQLEREITRVYLNGGNSFRLFKRKFVIEEVVKNHWRLTDDNNTDYMLRFKVNSRKLSFFLA